MTFATPLLADCLSSADFAGTGQIATKAGGTYEYGQIIGGEAGMRGHLTKRPNGLHEAQFDLQAGYHIDFADEGLARLLAPEATSAEAKRTELWVVFSPTRALPAARPGHSFSSSFLATVFALGPDDYNRRDIGQATLQGSYRFLDEISADFDSCSYRIIPVELDLTLEGQTVLKRRVLSFPDLGVAAITKWGPDADGPERKTGITRLGLAG